MRKVSQRYNLPPWMLGDPSEGELFREAELADIRDYLMEQERVDAGAFVPGKFPRRSLIGAPPGAYQEMDEE